MDYKLKIKQVRLMRNMTQAELAEKSNISQSYISQLEKNDLNAKSPTLRIVFRIAEALQVCPHLLVEFNTNCDKNCSNCCNIFF